MELLEITHEGEGFTAQVHFDRYRTLRISVRREGQVLVRAPQGTGLDWVRKQVLAKAAWISRHLERFRASQTALTPQPSAEGQPHWHLGQPHTLRLVRGRLRNAVRLEEGVLEVSTKSAPTAEVVRRVLDAWELEQAKELFPRLLRALLPRFDALGVPRPTRLKIRSMTSRWGSCTRAGSITLNRHLIRTPLACVEYVIAHELCHLRHHGHQAPFYQLLAQIMPDWKQRKARLKHL